MFTITKNRLPELRASLALVRNSQRRQVILKRAASSTGQKLQRIFAAAGPDGSKWEEPNYLSPRGQSIVHGRPSTRIHGSTLADSWQPVEVEETSRGTKFVIGTSTRQIEPLLTGTEPHFIPRGPQLITFWHFKSGREMFFGRTPQEAAGVNHPGIAQNNFVERSYRAQGQPIAMTAFRDSMGEVIRPVLKFYGG